MSQVSETLVSSGLNSLWTTTSETSKDASERSSSSVSPVSSSTSNMSRANQSYGLNRINQLAGAANAAFEGLGLGANDRVTFSRIGEYKDKLQEQFSEIVKAGLTEAGVDKDVEFQVVTSYNGEGIDIITDSEDKAKIIQFFNDYPELVDQFKEIQYLDNLSKTCTQEEISANVQMSKVQLQAMSSLFNTNPSSSIMSSGSNGSFFGMGLSTIV